MILLQSFSYLQQQGRLRNSRGHEEKTNWAYGSRSPSIHKSDRYDTLKDGRLLDTLDKGGDRNRYYSSSSSHRKHDHHNYHPYKRSDRGYLLDEFKRENPPTLYEDMKK